MIQDGQAVIMWVNDKQTSEFMACSVPIISPFQRFSSDIPALFLVTEVTFFLLSNLAQYLRIRTPIAGVVHFGWLESQSA